MERRARNETTEEMLASRVLVAERFFPRLVGLLGRRRLETGEALLLRPCASIHTCGMGFALDVLFLDGDGRVLRLVEGLPPWRFVAPVPGARAVLELAAGALAATGTRKGDRVRIDGA